MNAPQITVSILSDITALPAAQWDALAGPDPFTSHRFLAALEHSGSVGEGTGWHPAHLLARRDGALVGVAPLYLKTHSQGEYIFDHAWADAFARAGGDYYPKLQGAVPFTPATGRRLLSDDAAVRAALLAAMQQIARQSGLSGAHITFCTEAEAEQGRAAGFLPRVSQQFHWHNNGYADFDDFLSGLSSRKRKAIRKERARAQGFGGRISDLTGDQIRPQHWDAFWRFYQDTGSRKWGRPYLTRAFFDRIHDTMRDDILLIWAQDDDGQPVAGALNFIGPDALYGRYWGCVQDHPFLHFEMCYHRAVDWAIAHGKARVEAGAQGEHKLARGYLPARTWSLHWLAEPGFHAAIDDYLTQEAQAVGEDIDLLATLSPFRRD